MRPDLFRDKKCIHIKLTKEVHAGLRSVLFTRGMSMQEVHEELSRLIATGDKRLERILDEYARRRVQQQIDKLKAPKSKERIGELDQDALYDLINKPDPNET